MTERLLWGNDHIGIELTWSDEESPKVRQIYTREIKTFGVGLFKLDYDITAGAGTDHNAESARSGLLEASNALPAWIDGVLDRHPDLIIESCSSGAMRMDHGILAHTQLQSSSDQQDYRKYATIAASSPLAMLPEQSGHWAYPQPSMDAEAVAVHRATRQQVRHGVPFWPIGVPHWNDEIVALGLAEDRAGHQGALLAVWDRREGMADPLRISLSNTPPAVTDVAVLYPTGRRRVTWSSETNELVIEREGTAPQATFLRLT